MSTATARSEESSAEAVNWLAGGVGGVVGALAMAGLVVAMNAKTLAVAIPSLYALAPPPNLLLGVLVHAFHGAVLGLGFVAVLRALDLSAGGTVVGAGLAWGVVTWAVLAALLMPQWLSLVGSPASPPFPNFAPPSLLWHLVYGGVLAGVYVVTEDRLGA